VITGAASCGGFVAGITIGGVGGISCTVFLTTSVCMATDGIDILFFALFLTFPE
jgi:hypothetical protein